MLLVAGTRRRNKSGAIFASLGEKSGLELGIHVGLKKTFDTFDVDIFAE